MTGEEGQNVMFVGGMTGEQGENIIFLGGMTGEEGQKAVAVLVVLLLWRIARVVDGR